MLTNQAKGGGWTVGNIFSTLKNMGLSPKAIEAEGDEDLHLIALADPATTLRFGCLYAPDGGDELKDLALVCIIPAPNMTEADAAQINNRLPVAAAFLERGALWIYAELNTAIGYTNEFFSAQVELYLKDMRLALQLMQGGVGMSMKAAEVMVGLSRRRGDQAPMIRALSNVTKPPADKLSPPAGQTFANQKLCENCKGSGKGFFGVCRSCKGTGLARS